MFVVGLVVFDFDLEVEYDFGVEQYFYVFVCVLVDVFDLFVFVVDDDFFLFFVFYQDQCMDMQDVIFLFEFFDFYGDLVGQFGVELVYDFFVDQFGGQEVVVVVGDLVFGEEVFVFWQMFGDQFFQYVQVGFVLC